MREGTWCRVLPWVALLTVGCSSLQPEDAAPAKALQVDPAMAERFPGAAAIANGIDLSGERALRDGDRLLLGVEVVLGEEVERNMLELIVHRYEFGEDVARVSFTPTDEYSGPTIPSRLTRVLELEIVLRTPDGKEQRRSRLRKVPEFVLDESFVPAIHDSPEEQPVIYAVAGWRLIQVAQMLSFDPILQSLLRKAAGFPPGLSWLWRQDLSLVPYFEKGCAAKDEVGAYLLPFDLFFNDSLMVRLVATVTDPQGAAGAMAGIVGLRAQDARNPERHLKVQLLGASRGPRTDWQHDGVVVACGYADEGAGLAFSPDGRLVAMPGAGEDVELHDFTAADPSVATMLSCKGRSKDLAFLDDHTLLVATAHHVQVFDIADRNAPRLLATHEVPDQVLCALEVVDTETVFVGGNGYAISRWRFDADRSRPPAMELVQAVQRLTGKATIIDGTPSPVTITWTRTPAMGWLFGVDANRVFARSDDAETEWRCASDGSWTQQSMTHVDRPASRLRRLPDASPLQMFEHVAKGTSMVMAPDAGVQAFGAGLVSLSDGASTRFLCRNAGASNYCHGLSSDGRYYVYVAPGYRLFVDVERFLAGVE
jgi:hypothetical protein